MHPMDLPNSCQPIASQAMPGHEVTIATSLLGGPPDAVLPVVGSGPNRLFRVCTGQRHYALKRYGGSSAEATQLLQREVAACRFLASGPLGDCVPQLITQDFDAGVALFEWVTGEVPVQRRSGEVAQLQRLLSGLLTVSRGPLAAELPAAAGACHKPADLVRQIEAGREQLRAHDGIARFARILALFDAFWPSARAGLLLPQDPARLILSPVDVGLHKALRRPNGQLVFLGLSQFGWDDAARLVADLLWNPAAGLVPSETALLGATAHNVFGACDGGFSQRLSRLWPAIGLSWALRALHNARPAARQRQARLSRENTTGRQFDYAEICIRRVEESLHEVAA
jgi:hypothetical protein